MEHLRFRIVMIAQKDRVIFPETKSLPHFADPDLDRMIRDGILHRRRLHQETKPQSVIRRTVAVHEIFRQIRSVTDPLLRAGQIRNPFQIQYGDRKQ